MHERHCLTWKEPDLGMHHTSQEIKNNYTGIHANII